jgi:hypothetical protein
VVLDLLGLGSLVANLLDADAPWKGFATGVLTPVVISAFALSKGLVR